MTKADQACRELAAATAGAFAYSAARDVGMHGKLLKRRIRDGVLDAPSPRVLVLRGTPDTWEREMWTALIDAGPDAALSHDTALSLWGIPGFSRQPIHISRGRSRTSPVLDGVVLHRPRLWPERHRLLLNGTIPIVTPTRALFDLANEGETHLKKIDRSINTGWARDLTSGQRLAEMAQEWCERGRTGSAFVHEYLATHPISWQPPASNLEGRFRQIIIDAGMPEPRRQVDVGGGSAWIGRVDFLDPVLPLIAEIDSDLFHGAPLDAASDELRDEELLEAGFDIERFAEREVWYERETVVARWKRARDETTRRVRRTMRG